MVSKEKYLEKIIEDVLYNELDDEEKAAVEEQIGEKLFTNRQDVSENASDIESIVQIDFNNESGEPIMVEEDLIDSFEKLGEEKQKEQEKNSELRKEQGIAEEKKDSDITEEQVIEKKETEELEKQPVESVENKMDNQQEKIEEEIPRQEQINDTRKEDNQIAMDNENKKTEAKQKVQDVSNMEDVFAKSLSAVVELKDEELEEKYNNLVEQKQNSDETDERSEEKRQKKQKKQKKQNEKGIFHSIFGNVKTKEGQAEYEQMIQKEEKEKKVKEEEKIRQAEEKVKKEEAKKLEQERKKTLKQEEKEQKKKETEEKKRLKREELERQEEAYQGKINKIGASIVGVVGVAACLMLTIGTNRFGYGSAIENAQIEFERKRYTQAYNELIAVKLKDSEQTLYQQIQTVMYVQKPLNSYYNFVKMDQKVEALDSLLKVLKRYEKYYNQAKELSVDVDLDSIKATALSELSSNYKLTEIEGLALANMEDSTSYGEKLEVLVKGN